MASIKWSDESDPIKTELEQLMKKWNDQRDDHDDGARRLKCSSMHNVRVFVCVRDQQKKMNEEAHTHTKQHNQGI